MVSRVPTGVDNDVFGEIAHVDEGFVADGAFVGADIIVVADVVGQLARLHEPGEGDAVVTAIPVPNDDNLAPPPTLHGRVPFRHPAVEGVWRCLPHPKKIHGVDPHLLPQRSQT